MNPTTVKKKILKALKFFNENDKPYLYSTNVYEPTLSHRVALYLEQEFWQDGYVVDCEYNKNLDDPKMSDDHEKIRPDIIIHQRGNIDGNLVFIELKKAGKDSKLAKLDIAKLRKIKNLRYSHRLFIGIQKKKIDVVWVENLTQTAEQI